MNPPGKWVFRNFEYWFVYEPAPSLYGKIYPVATGKSNILWYWEARTSLESRVDPEIYPKGFVPDEKTARHLVETILWETETVRRPYGCPHGYVDSDNCPDCCH